MSFEGFGTDSFFINQFDRGDKEIVKELIQDELNTNNLVKELNMLLNNTNQQENLKMEYSKLYQLLSAGGHASQNATSLIMNFLKK